MGRRHRPRGVVVKESGASLPGWLEETWRRAGVEEAETSHSSSVGSDASVGNGAGAGGTRIQADGAEQLRASGRTQACGRPGASAAGIVSCIYS